MASELKTDVLIVGGGTGGVAAALGVAALGYSCVITEETDWLGGQLTSQFVPPDEHPHIESFGCTRRYRAYRDGVRKYYREHYPLTADARAQPRLNPGGGWVSNVCHEPRVGVAVIDQMLAPHVTAGRVRVLHHRVPVAATVVGDRVAAVAVRDTRTGEETAISAAFVLDATELGDLLPLAKTEYVTGQESRGETGEMHAPAVGRAGNVQAFTWCFAVGHDPGSHRVIDRPANYAKWRDFAPKLTPAWPGKLLSWTVCAPNTLKHVRYSLFPEAGATSMFEYRKVVDKTKYAGATVPHDVTLVNWVLNDYMEGNLIDRPREEVERSLRESRELSRSLLYWMQTEAPRGDGGVGYPGLYLRPDIAGTEDGLAKAPYIRESRRIKALFTVTEKEIGEEQRGGRPDAELFADSVGVGHYRIDLHPTTEGDNYIDVPSCPFQIPLGALIPVRTENLLAACKNIGTTHITNGCYRLHPVEWNIGESAGLLAGYCLARGTSPRGVRENAAVLKDFQGLLERQGVELGWPRAKPIVW